MIWFKVEGIYGNYYWIRSDAITYFGYNKKENWTAIANGDESIKAKGNLVGRLAKELFKATKSTVIELKDDANE